MFVVPTIQKMSIYLENVMDWEKFGYYLLAGDKEQLIEVATNYCSCSLLLNELFESFTSI